MTNPLIIQPLGLITVPTPGTPVPVSAQNLPAVRAYFQGQIGGVGKVYLGVAGMSKASGAGVMKVFWPTGAGGGIPDQYTIDGLRAGDEDLDMSVFYIDADNAGEGLRATAFHV